MSSFLRPCQLIPELLNPSLDIGLQVFRPLMFGDSAQHFLQTFEALSRLSRLPIIRLGLLVFWTDVGRHGDLAECF